MTNPTDLKVALTPKSTAAARELLARQRGESAHEDLSFEEAGLDREKPTPEEINSAQS